MKTNIQTELRITLELNTAEAIWLKSLVQNAQCDAESPENAEMRENLFEALPSFPELLNALTKD